MAPRPRSLLRHPSDSRSPALDANWGDWSRRDGDAPQGLDLVSGGPGTPNLPPHPVHPHRAGHKRCQGRWENRSGKFPAPGAGLGPGQERRLCLPRLLSSAPLRGLLEHQRQLGHPWEPRVPRLALTPVPRGACCSPVGFSERFETLRMKGTGRKLRAQRERRPPRILPLVPPSEGPPALGGVGL